MTLILFALVSPTKVDLAPDKFDRLYTDCGWRLDSSVQPVLPHPRLILGSPFSLLTYLGKTDDKYLSIPLFRTRFLMGR